MSQTNQNGGTPTTNQVFVVTCYGNLIGVYSKSDDAWQVANQRIQKGHPADVLSRPIL